MKRVLVFSLTPSESVLTLYVVRYRGCSLMLHWTSSTTPPLPSISACCKVFIFVLQQIAFKNLVQRNRQTEQQANRPPPPNSIIHLPFIIVNTSKKTVIDCSISNDKYVNVPAVILTTLYLMKKQCSDGDLMINVCTLEGFIQTVCIQELLVLS